VSASVNLPLHHKVQKFSSGTGSPGWSRKKGHKMVVVVLGGLLMVLLHLVFHMSNSVMHVLKIIFIQLLTFVADKVILFFLMVYS